MFTNSCKKNKMIRLQINFNNLRLINQASMPQAFSKEGCKYLIDDLGSKLKVFYNTDPKFMLEIILSV